MYISAMTAFQKSAFRFLQSKAKRKTHIKLSVPILFLGCWTLCELSDTWCKGHLRKNKSRWFVQISLYLFYWTLQFTSRIHLQFCWTFSISSVSKHLEKPVFVSLQCVHFLVYKRLFSFLRYFLVFLFLFGMFMMLEQYFKLLGVTSVIKSNLKSLYAELTTMSLNLH